MRLQTVSWMDEEELPPMEAQRLWDLLKVLA